MREGERTMRKLSINFMMCCDMCCEMHMRFVIPI